MGIEELTKEELVSWIRGNVPGLDEKAILLQFLPQRDNLAWQKYREADERFWSINEQIRKLVEAYADGPVKPGVRLRRWPAVAKQEYERLDRERNDARKERDEWFQKEIEISRRIWSIQSAKMDKWIEEG